MPVTSDKREINLVCTRQQQRIRLTGSDEYDIAGKFSSYRLEEVSKPLAYTLPTGLTADIAG